MFAWWEWSERTTNATHMQFIENRNGTILSDFLHLQTILDGPFMKPFFKRCGATSISIITNPRHLDQQYFYKNWRQIVYFHQSKKGSTEFSNFQISFI